MILFIDAYRKHSRSNYRELLLAHEKNESVGLLVKIYLYLTFSNLFINVNILNKKNYIQGKRLNLFYEYIQVTLNVVLNNYVHHHPSQ